MLCLTVVGRLGIDLLDGVLKSFDKALDGVCDTARIGRNLKRSTACPLEIQGDPLQHIRNPSVALALIGYAIDLE